MMLGAPTDHRVCKQAHTLTRAPAPGHAHAPSFGNMGWGSPAAVGGAGERGDGAGGGGGGGAEEAGGVHQPVEHRPEHRRWRHVPRPAGPGHWSPLKGGVGDNDDEGEDGGADGKKDGDRDSNKEERGSVAGVTAPMHARGRRRGVAPGGAEPLDVGWGRRGASKVGGRILVQTQ